MAHSTNCRYEYSSVHKTHLIQALIDNHENILATYKDMDEAKLDFEMIVESIVQKKNMVILE